MSNELVSVIMSTYNEPMDWIEKAVDSILKQTLNNLELIIVNDNPINNELEKKLIEIKQSDPRIVIIKNEVNLGLTKSLNRAIKYSKGKYIVRMDSDDISHNSRLQWQLEYLIENKLDLVGGGVYCIDENGEKIHKLNNFPKDNDSVIKKIELNNCIPHPTWFARREVFESLKGYREVPYAEDYDFLLRALKYKFKLGNINKVVLEYRMRASSISNKNGLKQFLVSQELVKAYKNDYITNENLVNDSIKDIILEIKLEEEEKYLKSSVLFNEGVKSYNPFKVIKAIYISRFYRRKIWCYIRGIA